MPRRKTTEPKMINTPEDAAALLAKCDVEKALAAVEAGVVIRRNSKNSIDVICRGVEENVTSIRKRRDGSISVLRNGRPAHNQTLPDPRDAGKRKSPVNSLGLQHHIRGASERAIIRLVTAEMDDHTSTTRLRVRAEVPRWIALQGTAIATRLRRRDAYREVEDHVRRMLNRTAWDSARNREGKVTVERYNRAVAGGKAIQELKETNPGAAGWVLADERMRQPQGTYRHPGQVIQATRKRMEQAGVERQHWRLISGIAPEAMEAITGKSIAKWIQVLILNACGEARIRPSRATAAIVVTFTLRTRWRCQVLGAPRRNAAPAYQAAPQRMKHVLKIVLKHRGTDETEHGPHEWREVHELADYIADKINNDEDITATTMGGLRKAAEAWHLHMNHAEAAAAIRKRIERDQGWYRAWNTLIDEITLPNQEGEPLTAKPLTDELQLLDEGVNMRHCVATYDVSCSKGRSRIFSIRRGGERVATTELSNQAGRWRAVQTRGYRNGRVPEHIRAIATNLASAYQKAWLGWEGTRSARHQSWLKNETSGETKAVR